MIRFTSTVSASAKSSYALSNSPIVTASSSKPPLRLNPNVSTLEPPPFGCPLTLPPVT